MVTQVLNLHNLILLLNTGVFGVNDVVELLNKDKFKKQGFNIQYLVIAGGGAGNDNASTFRWCRWCRWL